MLNFFICKISLLQHKVCERLGNYLGIYNHFKGDQQQSQGLISSLITKIVNNLQVTVKNIHIRYEDRLSVPGVGQSASSVVSGSVTRRRSTLLQRASRYPASRLFP